MFDVGGGELLLIVMAVLVLFGPKKIPEVASMVGKGMRKVRQAQDEFTQHLRDLSTELEKETDVSHIVNPAIESLPEATVVSESERVSDGPLIQESLPGLGQDETTDTEAAAPIIPKPPQPSVGSVSR